MLDWLRANPGWVFVGMLTLGMVAWWFLGKVEGDGQD